MAISEKGVLPHSQYFFFTPSESFRNYHYYALVCGHFYCTDGYRIAREGNVSPIIFYIVAGKLHVNHEGKHQTASKGEVVLINGYKPHEYYCTSNCEFLFMHFDGGHSLELIHCLHIQNDGVVLVSPNNQQVSKIINSIMAKLRLNQIPADGELSCGVYAMLCGLQVQGENLEGHPASSEIISTMHFIKNNVGASFTLDALANRVNLSKYYFSHLFKQETGLSPMAYIADTKINLAKTILKTTSKTIEEIASYLGYSSSSSFINAFKKREGVSPHKFRQQAMK